MDEMGSLISSEKLIETLRGIERAEHAQRDLLAKILEKLKDELFGPAETPKKEK
jgi:hypothetical protein